MRTTKLPVPPPMTTILAALGSGEWAIADGMIRGWGSEAQWPRARRVKDVTVD